MGSGSSSPRSTEGGGVDTDGGAMFQQRPPHCRLEGKNQVSSDDEFTDVSYSDLGHIITPKTKRLTINNNYKTSRERETKDQIQACRPSTPTPSATDEGYFDQDCDMVSSQVESGHAGPACSSTTTTTNSNSSSKASFSSTHLPGTANHHPSLATNLGDLEVEEITS
nr:uncharacterized protein LOC128700008 [Cherax quadricarinatus]